MTSEMYSLANPVFRAFVSHAALMLLKTCLMSVMTGFMRVKNKAYANEEDASFAKVKKLTSNPTVERIRRAHLNDLENVLPFVLLGGLYVATGPSLGLAATLFRAFSLARLLHTLVYLTQAPQPFRGLVFNAGIAVNFALGGQVLWSVLGSI